MTSRTVFGQQHYARWGERIARMSSAPTTATPPASAPPSGSASSAGSLRGAIRVAGNAAAAAGYALRMADIDADSRRWQERLRALRDCAENPTNAVARRAMREDPNYRRATLDRIEAAELEQTFTTNARRFAATTNAGAGAVFSLLGSAGTGLIGEVEDSLLERTMKRNIGCAR